MTWEEAKQQIAERRNMPDWEFMMAAYEGLSIHVGMERFTNMVTSAFEGAAEIMESAYQAKLGTYRGLARLDLFEELKNDAITIIPSDWEPDHLKG